MFFYNIYNNGYTCFFSFHKKYFMIGKKPQLLIKSKKGLKRLNIIGVAKQQKPFFAKQEFQKTVWSNHDLCNWDKTKLYLE